MPWHQQINVERLVATATAGSSGATYSAVLETPRLLSDAEAYAFVHEYHAFIVCQVLHG